MGTVVRLQEVRDAKTPHWKGPAVCMVCGHRWMARATEGTTWFECPQCLTEHGHMVYPHELPGSHWRCNCGNYLFQVTPEGLYCPHCGTWAEGV